MVRLLFRVLGYLMLAGAFVTVVVDGTRSIAAASLVWLRLGEVLDRLSPKLVPAMQGALQGLRPVLWDSFGSRLMAAPLAGVLLVLGVALVLLATNREPSVGVVARR